MEDLILSQTADSPCCKQEVELFFYGNYENRNEVYWRDIQCPRCGRLFDARYTPRADRPPRRRKGRQGDGDGSR